MKKAFFLLLFILGLMAGLSHVGPRAGSIEGALLTVVSPAYHPFVRIDVLYEPENTVVSMDLEDYVVNVVASEMPASFRSEALKAQAVLARTYAVRKMQVFGGNPSYPGRADVSSNPAKDQAWNPEHVIKERWGIIGAWLNWPKIERAVLDTRGLILTYKGLPAEALYHSTCGGVTEAAKDVWGNDVEYLKSVTCGFCTSSPHYKQRESILSSDQISAFMAGLGISLPASRVSQKGTMAVTALSPTGRVKEISVDGRTVRGVEFRSALGLKSTKLTWSVKGDNIIFQTSGYGHGVGLCQYGADGAAKAGMDFLSILSHYYPGTETVQIFAE